MTGEHKLPQPGELLDQRQSLPADLTWLYERYPRDIWQGHQDLGDMARFWLRRHDMFREVGSMLQRGIDEWREKPDDPGSLSAWMAPRINFFLGQLNDHHQIEDHYYFPLFKGAEPKLERGFDLLDSDHHVIHEALEGNAETANAFFESLVKEKEAARYAADAYASANEQLVALLTRHLADEEDLIIPMVLDRGEANLMAGSNFF